MRELRGRCWISAVAMGAILVVGIAITSVAWVSLWSPAEEDSIWCHTFSIAAYDPDAKEWGVATASRVLAVGSIVPWGKPGVGVVATQSYANLTFGDRGLELLRQGKSADEAVKQLIDGDAERGVRQLAMIDRDGKPAAFTGDDCLSWHGQKLGEHHVCVGNLLAGPEVLEAMHQAFETTKGPLARRLMAALKPLTKQAVIDAASSRPRCWSSVKSWMSWGTATRTCELTTMPLP